MAIMMMVQRNVGFLCSQYKDRNHSQCWVFFWGYKNTVWKKHPTRLNCLDVLYMFIFTALQICCVTGLDEPFVSDIPWALPSYSQCVLHFYGCFSNGCIMGQQVLVRFKLSNNHLPKKTAVLYSTLKGR